MTKVNGRPRWEVADVIRRFGGAYREARHVPVSHLRVMKHIAECRTAAMGGHLEECDQCSHQRPVYNSCRDRHCPKCGSMAKEKWIAERKEDLLPVDYFHCVFTLPHELNLLVLSNKQLLLNILFRAVSETLLDFGKNQKKAQGGKIGFTLVLHTWSQQLFDHFHIHCVIPAGVLSHDHSQWIANRYRRFLFPVKALGIVFRGKFLHYLRQAFAKNSLHFHGALTEMAHPSRFESFVETLATKEWVVYSKAPFGGPEKVLDYLGRYTHRVAISNHRLIEVSKDLVTFTYRDRNDDNKKKTATVTGHEFIRRFLLHVLPNGFMRIRHYGFLASRRKKELLNACRRALGVKDKTRRPSPKTIAERLKEITGVDIKKCPCCAAGHMTIRRPLHPSNIAGDHSNIEAQYANTS